MMKKIFIAIILLMIFVGGYNAQGITNYSYKFKINGLKDTVCYLGFHFGEKKFVRDTARINSKGEVEFKKKNDTIPGGIYLFVLPNKRWFEFVINEPSFYIETDTIDLAGHAKIKGSVENQIWFDYLKKMAAFQKEIEPLRKERDSLDKQSPRYKDLDKKLGEINQQINKYREDIMEKNKGTFMAYLFKVMKDVEIPESPKNPDGTIDSTFQYRYFKAHYFDHVNFSDARILRTPIFEPKFTYFLEKVIPQIPDSIISEVDKVIEKARANPEMFKYVVHTTTYTFERSQLMCMDAVFVHMVEKYYNTGQATWVDQKTLEKMKERASKLKPLLCGKQAPNLILPDTNMVWHNLYKLQADYTILYFWDATCGHCKKNTPKLKELYETYLKPNNIPVYAVEGELETTEWKKYLVENKLPWINVSDSPEINKNPEKYIHLTDLPSLNFRHTYDLSTYPVVYVLDREKKIIGKKIGIEQIKDFIEGYKKVKSSKK
ncbi:MAG: DUF5106 domain-containing protein [Flavobacteriales bacterium]|nr:DUF5106 domain-containing protein [Flavobacteriales bacterium]